MYESRIAADRLLVASSPGLAPAVDVLAACNLSGHGFLRAAWYGADGAEGLRSFLVAGADGAPLAVIPHVPFGPALAGARKVPGAYWPFRSPLLAPACTPFHLAGALRDPAARSLGPVWRVGPARRDDPAIVLLRDAAREAGWTVLARPAGTSWVIDCEALRAGGWPRASTARRIRRIERRLPETGAVSWEAIRGKAWNNSVLEELAAIEAASWIAAKTDGSGAKFLTESQRARWRAALTDPVIADMLCATILRVDGRAVAFSFDLDDGPVRYGIAGSYVSEFSQFEVGKLANHRALADAIAAGQSLVDLGAGDSGYKREMGAVRGYDLDDFLFVRSRTAARVMARVWGEALSDA